MAMKIRELSHGDESKVEPSHADGQHVEPSHDDESEVEPSHDDGMPALRVFTCPPVMLSWRINLPGVIRAISSNLPSSEVP